MGYQSREFAIRWKEMSLLEQLANIGSEVDRALHWKAKKNTRFTKNAIERALELLDFTLDSTPEGSRRRELTIVREGLMDYFCGNNKYQFTDEAWRKYFLDFAYVLRKNS